MLLAASVLHNVLRRRVVVLAGVAVLSSGRATAQPQAFIKFDGTPDNYVEIDDPSTADFSVNPGVGFTVAVWMRPDALHFVYTDGSDPNQQYVHWLGKGMGSDDNAQQEWTFRIYSQNEPCDVCPRLNRVSFYVFNLARPPGMVCQNEGIGSYFQYPINDPDPIVAGDWIHVVGVVDDSDGVKTTAIYKNGNFIRCDRYQATDVERCQRLPDQGPGQCPRPITPTHGTAPVRIGHRDRLSYLNGAVAQVRMWNRALNAGEVMSVYLGGDPAPDVLLMGQYLLNETGDDTTAHDTSGNPTGPHDGRVLGTTWMWGP
jgi:hypothetical protein